MDDREMDAATFALDQADAASTLREYDEEAPEGTTAQMRHDAAIEAAIAATPIKRPDDWAAQIARNQALDELRGGRGGNPVFGGSQPEDDPDFLEPDWGHLKYDPKPATDFAVTAMRGRLSKAVRAKRQAELAAKQSIDSVTVKVRELLGAKPTPHRDAELGRHISEARTLVVRGAWDSCVAAVPMARSEAYRFMKLSKAAA